MTAQEQAMDELERNKAFVRRAYEEIINGHDTQKIREYVKEGAREHSVLGEANGIEELIQSSEGLARAFPDIHLEIHDVIAERDMVVTRGTLSGTHKGDLAGIPATGRRFSVVEIDIVRIEDGKMAEHWDAIDTASMFDQLGIGAPGQPQA